MNSYASLTPGQWSLLKRIEEQGSVSLQPGDIQSDNAEALMRLGLVERVTSNSLNVFMSTFDGLRIYNLFKYLL